jgi:hypothetical protein
VAAKEILGQRIFGEVWRRVIYERLQPLIRLFSMPKMGI